MILSAVITALLLAAVPLLAQTVSDDAVNDVAEHMFCPVCENEPLDDCRTSTCLQWKEEIRDQLAAGRSENQIMDYFVARYGQHVLAIPSDPLLRVLSYAIPLIATLAALAVGWLALRRWQTRRPVTQSETVPVSDSSTPQTSPADDDPYRAMLERDID
jgi:cytochrome c-type biogenesis protein CcmH